MRIEERPIGNVVILDLKGQLTIGEGDEDLRRKITALLEQSQNRILLNMAECPYVDSMGLGAIVRGHTRTMRSHGVMKILNPTKAVLNLFATTKLLSVFEIFEDEAKALASFNKTVAP